MKIINKALIIAISLATISFMQANVVYGHLRLINNLDEPIAYIVQSRVHETGLNPRFRNVSVTRRGTIHPGDNKDVFSGLRVAGREGNAWGLPLILTLKRVSPSTNQFASEELSLNSLGNYSIRSDRTRIIAVPVE